LFRLPVVHDAPLPVAPWSSKIHGYEFFGATEKWVHIGFAPFCAMECRYLIEGELITIGIDPQRVDGDCLKDMRRILLTMSADKLCAYFMLHGAWTVTAKAGELVVIPTGVILLQIASASTIGLRWGLASDVNDKLRCLGQLTMLVDDFPELRSATTGYVQFKEFLSRQE
jgi:hypothetical protein